MIVYKSITYAYVLFLFFIYSALEGSPTFVYPKFKHCIYYKYPIRKYSTILNIGTVYYDR